MLEQIKELDDPQRCQSVTKHGQCRYKKSPGLSVCESHGAMQIARQKKETLANYRLLRYEDRLIEKKNSNEVKTLREEISILRMTLEDILIKASNTDEGLFLYSPRILAMVEGITKTIQACHMMEEKVGSVLDKSKVLMIADSITTIVSRHINDAILLDKISGDINTNIESICTSEMSDALAI